MTLSLMPIPRVQFFDGNGNPLAGGKIYTFDAGTSTPKATYTDSTGQTKNTNPVVLDSRGEASIWLSGYYKVVVKDADENSIYEEDYVSSMPSSTVVLSEWLATGHVLTYVGATQFSVPGDETPTYQVGRRVKCVVSAGTIYGTVTASSYSAGTTTVTVALDSGSLDSGLSSVDIGVLSATNPALPMTYIMGKDPIYRALDSAGTQVMELKYDEANDKLVLNAPEGGATIELQLQGAVKLALASGGLIQPTIDRPTLKFASTAKIQDTGGNYILELFSSTTPVNWVRFENSDSGSGVSVVPNSSTDTDVDLRLRAKGNGVLKGEAPFTLTAGASGTPSVNTLYQQNILKGWINFNGSGTIAIRDSFNVASIVDNGVGDYTINWDTDFADANYSVVGMTYDSTLLSNISGNGLPAAGSVSVVCSRNELDNVLDPEAVFVMAVGNQ